MPDIALHEVAARLGGWSQDRQVVWRGSADTQPSMIAERLRSWKGHLAKVGLETGSLTPWLYHELKGLGFPIICMDARRATDALKARPEKTVKADAQALAEMLVSGWHSPVHVKTMESHRLKALLCAREQLDTVKRQLYEFAREPLIDRCDSENTPSLVGISCLSSLTPQPIPVLV